MSLPFPDRRLEGGEVVRADFPVAVAGDQDLAVAVPVPPRPHGVGAGRAALRQEVTEQPAVVEQPVGHYPWKCISPEPWKCMSVPADAWLTPAPAARTPARNSAAAMAAMNLRMVTPRVGAVPFPATVLLWFTVRKPSDETGAPHDHDRPVRPALHQAPGGDRRREIRRHRAPAIPHRPGAAGTPVAVIGATGPRPPET